jgi:hypothetical protein
MNETMDMPLAVLLCMEGETAYNLYGDVTQLDLSKKNDVLEALFKDDIYSENDLLEQLVAELVSREGKLCYDTAAMGYDPRNGKTLYYGSSGLLVLLHDCIEYTVHKLNAARELNKLVTL